MEKVYKCLRLTALVGVFLFSAVAAKAQDQTVSGTVKDETGTPLPGVNVLIKGTTTGTATDGDGKYTLSVPANSTLVFTFVGYTTSEVPVGTQSVVDVQLQPDATTLSEIVVTGYASQQKKDLTGAVGTVKTSDLTAIPTSNVTTQLQGRVSGVTVSGDGQPGTVAKVRIRGFGSLSGQNQPLYIVDGVPTQDVSTINPNDIESLNVLKDAGAASIYGSRASNGVVVITTKKGAQGVKISYSGYIGTQSPGKGPTNLLNAQEYANLQWLVYKNDGTNETHPIYGPSSNPNPTLPSWAGDTDWYGQITRAASIQNHDISLTGGNQSGTYYLGLNYFNQEGIVITNFAKRISARFNSEFKALKGRISIGENFALTGRTSNRVSGNGTEGSPISRVYAIQPIIPAVVTQDITGISHNFIPGEYGGTGIAVRLGNGSNPYADLQRNKDDRGGDVRVVGSTFLSAKIIEGLTAKTTIGGTFVNYYYTDWAGSTYERSENIATPAYTEGAGYYGDWVWTNQLTYDKTFGKHKILAVGGYEAVKTNIARNLTASKAGFFSSNLPYRTVTNGTSNPQANSSHPTASTLASAFLRFDYGYNERYLLSGTIRRDGSSRFGSQKRYAVFPSISGAWRISEEGFMSGISAISDLKIRGGYGTLGNQIPVFPENQFYTYGGGVGDSYYSINGSNNSSSQGIRPTSIGNTAGKWETNIMSNIGFEAGLLNNKLQVTFDWYEKKVKDLLFQPQPLGIQGAATVPYYNLASMKNNGIDLQINYKHKVSGDLSFDGTLTFTSYNNQITKITSTETYFPGNFGDSRIGSFTRNQVGHPMGAFYGYQIVGLWQTAAEVTQANAADGNATTLYQDGAEPGFFRYADLDGNNVIDGNDRTFIGNPNPKFTFGFNLGVTYKRFDLSAFLYGSQGNDIFNYNRWWLDFWPSFQNQKSSDLLYKSWTPENTGAKVPKASNKSNFSTNTQSSNYYLEDGSFMRLRNLQIGYSIPQSVLQKIGVGSARVYLQGVNLFTITKYTGLDPDVNNGGDQAFGVDLGNYPGPRTYTVGLNVSF